MHLSGSSRGARAATHLTRRWTRRSFLRAAGVGAGATALLPFMPRSIADAGTGPKRIVIVTHGNGVDLPRWRSTGGESDFTLGYSLEPFAPYRDRLLVLDGVDNEAIADEGRRGTGHFGMSTLWTGRELPAGEFGENQQGWPAGPSVDHVIGERVGDGARFNAFYWGTSGSKVGSEGPIRTAHHRGPDQPVQTENFPAQAFDTLFAGVAGDAAAAARIRARRRSVLDLVRGDLGRVRSELPTSDRDRMDEHLSHLRVLEERIANAAVCAPPSRPRDFTYAEQSDSENLPLVSGLQLDLVARALTCDLTRVACFQWGGEGSNGSGSFLDDAGYDAFTGGVHTTTHEMTYDAIDGRPVTDDERTRARRNMADLTRWRSEMLVAFLDGMPSEVRDNTLLVWSTAMSEGGNHSNRNVPVVIHQGSAMSYFKTGAYLRWGDFDPLAARNGHNAYHGGVPMNRLLVSMCHAMDCHDVRSFGEPDIDSRPLEELRR
jgi:hypothetical protein